MEITRSARGLHKRMLTGMEDRVAFDQTPEAVEYVRCSFEAARQPILEDVLVQAENSGLERWITGAQAYALTWAVLRAHADEAKAHLVRRLAEMDPAAIGRRTRIASVLVQLGSPEGRTELLRLLRHEDAATRKRALESASKAVFEEESLRAGLFAVTSDEDPEVRREAVWVCKQTRVPGTFDRFLEILGDESRPDRGTVALSLSLAGEKPEAIDIIKRALESGRLSPEEEQSMLDALHEYTRDSFSVALSDGTEARTTDPAATRAKEALVDYFRAAPTVPSKVSLSIVSDLPEEVALPVLERTWTASGGSPGGARGALALLAGYEPDLYLDLYQTHLIDLLADPDFGIAREAARALLGIAMRHERVRPEIFDAAVQAVSDRPDLPERVPHWGRSYVVRLLLTAGGNRGWTIAAPFVENLSAEELMWVRWKVEGWTLNSFFDEAARHGLLAEEVPPVRLEAAIEAATSQRALALTTDADILPLVMENLGIVHVLETEHDTLPKYGELVESLTRLTRGRFLPVYTHRTYDDQMEWVSDEDAEMEMLFAVDDFAVRAQLDYFRMNVDERGLVASLNAVLAHLGLEERFVSVHRDYTKLGFMFGRPDAVEALAEAFWLPLPTLTEQALAHRRAELKTMLRARPGDASAG